MPLLGADNIQIAARYAGPKSNNGRIAFSIRDAATILKIGKSKAAETFAVLKERGFIREMRKGKFDRKSRHSSEWRLTEFACDLTGKLPTKDFARWKPENAETVPTRGPDGISARTVGISVRTVKGKKAAHGT